MSTFGISPNPLAQPAQASPFASACGCAATGGACPTCMGAMSASGGGTGFFQMGAVQQNPFSMAPNPFGMPGMQNAGTPGMMSGMVPGMMPGMANDPLAQMGMQSMTSDTRSLFISLTGMMVGVMSLIATTLAAILSGAISGKAPPGSTPNPNTPGTPQPEEPGGNNNMPNGSVKQAPAGNYGGTSLNAEQTKNAAIIAEVGQEMGMSQKDIQVAIATAMQESTLKNLDYGDRDSVGLFQQRTSQGWGTVKQIMDPRYSARKFFEALKKQKNRDSRSVTDLAQSVQRSAFPDAYAKWAGMADALVKKMLGMG